MDQSHTYILSFNKLLSEGPGNSVVPAEPKDPSAFSLSLYANYTLQSVLSTNSNNFLPNRAESYEVFALLFHP